MKRDLPFKAVDYKLSSLPFVYVFIKTAAYRIRKTGLSENQRSLVVKKGFIESIIATFRPCPVYAFCACGSESVLFGSENTFSVDISRYMEIFLCCCWLLKIT